MHRLYIGNVQFSYEVLRFKGGEMHVKLPQMSLVQLADLEGARARIFAHLRSSDDIMELLVLTDAVRRRHERIQVELCMPYIPYARQDRVCADGESLSIKVFCDLINSQNYREVLVWDPHSDVAPALLNNCRVYHQKIFVDRALNKLPKRDNVILVSPDAGANKKILDVAQYCRVTNIVRADKVRNVKDGSITGTMVYSQPVGSKDFLVVDDICDGGRTFLELAKVLRPLTTGKLFLYVTHGIFSAGLSSLADNFDLILTPNSFLKETHPKLIDIQL